MEIKYELPRFLEGTLTRQEYVGWLDVKAMHYDRDRDRFGQQLERSRANYKEDIHDAVRSSKDRDFYTGEKLDWSLVRKYDSDEAKKKPREYRRKFARLPTVDHEDPGNPNTALRICAWRTNDWKSDLTVQDLKELCKKFLRTQRWASFRRLLLIR